MTYKGRGGLWLAALAVVVTIALVMSGCAGSAPVPATSTPTKAESSNPAASPVANSGQGELSGSIQVKGSDTMVNLGSAWAEEFMKQNPKVTVAVTGGGSGTGIAALINKSTDVTQSSRPMKQEEIDKAKAAGVGAKEMIVALDGLAVVVNPGNQVKELTFSQLADIFTGKLTNWRDVGGTDAPIVVLSRDTNSGTHVFFKEHVVQSKDKKAEYGQNVQMMSSSQAGVQEVSQNPNAIFYVGLGYVSEGVRVLGIKKDDASPAIQPSAATVKDGSYPVARPLYFYTDGEPTGIIKAFVDYALSADGQKIVSELDFVTVS